MKKLLLLVPLLLFFGAADASACQTRLSPPSQAIDGTYAFASVKYRKCKKVFRLQLIEKDSGSVEVLASKRVRARYRKNWKTVVTGASCDTEPGPEELQTRIIFQDGSKRVSSISRFC